MFDGLSAWFSTSVSRGVKRQWVDRGGGETSLEDAQFIFSQDTAALDTQSVFDSDAYLEEHLAVFHPSFIRECVKHGNVRNVTLGKYFFPPADVQAIAREQLQYQWDIDGNTYHGETSSSSDGEEPARLTGGLNEAPRSSNHSTLPVGHGNSQNKSKDVSKKSVPSDISSETRVKDNTASVAQRKQGSTKDSVDFVQSDKHKEMEVEPRRKSPRKSIENKIDSKAIDSQKNRGMNESKIELSPQKRVTAERKGKGSCLSASRKSQSDVEDSHFNVNEGEKKKTTERVMRKRNTNSSSRSADVEESEILKLEELAKVTGDLQDFIVGKNGCELIKLS